MEVAVRTRKVVKHEDETELDSEADLLKFCSEQISKMKKHLKQFTTCAIVNLFLKRNLFCTIF